MPAANSRASQLRQMIETARSAGLEIVGIEITPKRIYLETKSVAVPVDDSLKTEPTDDAYARMKAELMR